MEIKDWFYALNEQCKQSQACKSGNLFLWYISASLTPLTCGPPSLVSGTAQGIPKKVRVAVRVSIDWMGGSKSFFAILARKNAIESLTCKERTFHTRLCFQPRSSRSRLSFVVLSYRVLGIGTSSSSSFSLLLFILFRISCPNPLL